MDSKTLKKAIPAATWANIDKFLSPLNQAMEDHNINTPMRIAHFLAQIAWESGSLKYVEEIASGSAYEGRKDLGNTEPGENFHKTAVYPLRNEGNLYIIEFDFIGSFARFRGKPPHTNKQFVEGDVISYNNQPQVKVSSLRVADKDEFTKITKIINGSTITVKKRLPCLRSAKIATGLIK